MKKIYLWLLFMAASALTPLVSTAHARTARVFVIGNSFSRNATQYLLPLAKEGGHELTIGRAEFPSSTLQQHWEAVAAAEANPEDPKGKPYTGKSLRELLGTGTWDVVTLQQGSFPSGYPDTYRPYVRHLRDFIKKLQPQAEVVLHQTWAYRSDATKFAVVDRGRTAATDREMWEKTRAAYHTIADELNMRLIPVGDAFWRASSDAHWGYKKDAKFDFAHANYPHLPDQKNSLHSGYSWQTDKDGNRRLELDASHANDAGSYLAGLVWYGFLFRESPAKLTFSPAPVPVEFAAFLRQTSAQVIAEKSVKR